VVAGAAAPDRPAGLAAAVAQVHAHVQNGATMKDAVAAVAAGSGLRRRELYNAVAARNEGEES
jgi:hypothetical protein